MSDDPDHETCRHCGEEIIPCPHARFAFCKGWRHAAYIASQPVISHYCGGRSAGPLAEPGEQIAVCRADLADLLARVPHEGEARDRLAHRMLSTRRARPDGDAFTCPCCGAVSHNPHDREQGYCGRCHWWTGDPELGAPHFVAACQARAVALRRADAAAVLDDDLEDGSSVPR